ncbi:ribosomal protein S5 domain 2-type protein [Microdochium bolleyi]|uniref:Phosphomevalonate kinase n=1 Tax=Microdochium bolleyi TaxID=196109 RepID=A0A136JER0_9PEZI|nr:ribosomal protein S5 domain 2-type protein [Microdochium bolleyi]
MAPSETPVAVSAPGKVLLAGGYLVLDRAYTGLVFGLSARINVVARRIPTSPGVQLSEIVVDSPQFLEAQWRYGYHLAPERGGFKVTQFQVGSSINANPFVETTLSYALTFISSLAPTSQSFSAARFTVLADNDYYSQPHSAAGTGEKNPTRFAKFPTALRDAHKTGLGSSAALVTALTAALLTYYLPKESGFDLATPEGQRILHNLAQAAHCAAQGKVGSGFDVAAAVYGSCRYRRFSPSILKGLPEAGAPGFAPALFACVKNAEWDTEIAKDGVSLPPGIALRMCDVDCGSQTVGMVKKVLAWREQKPEESKTLWDDLQAQNEKLGATLRAGQLEEVSGAVTSVRELIRAMGSESGVPIEPESQTALLDALQSVEGVYNGVVPGAGGFDALALVMKDDEETEARVRVFLSKWSEERGGVVRMLDVRGEMEGARRESLDQYDGWVQ